MIALYPYIFVEIDPEANKVKYINGQPLYMSTDYHRRNEGVIFGNVYAVPDKINSEINPGDEHIKKGQKIYFHWNNVVNLDNRFELKNGEKNIFRIRWASVFGKVEEKENGSEYQCIHDWMLVDPLIQEDSDLERKSGLIIVNEMPVMNRFYPKLPKNFTQKKKAKSLQGTIFSLPKKLTYGYAYQSDTEPLFRQEMKVGDEIYFSELSDWELGIEGKLHYMMKLDDAVLINNPK